MCLINLYYIWFFFLVIFSFIFLLVRLVLLLDGCSILIEWVLFNYNTLSFVYVIYLDWISTVFIFVVLLISSIVVLYRRNYIGQYNYSSIRFLLLVLLFVLSILLIILSPNLVRILLGWDGLGLVSYCLVIYYRSSRSYLAGIITCLINRLGDIGLLLSIGWIFRYGGYTFIFYLSKLDSNFYYLIIISSFTKRAQIPFSSWLPAAIAAPTPVSALVHSSTLVTAGVYLLIRFFNILVYRNYYFLFMSIITIIISSLCALYEFDLKKIIALSTLSQLGLIISCLFIGSVDLAYFHLLSHAIFKSLLFLCAGVIIHLLGGCQDIRAIGCICISLPLTCCCLNISNIALCGFPFLSGFYSKDLIVESSSFVGLNVIFIFLFYFRLGLTSFYRIRLFYYTNMAKFNYSSLLGLVESIDLIKYRIVSLSFMSIIFGCSFVWVFSVDINFLLFPFTIKIFTILLVFTGLYFGFEVRKARSLYFLPSTFYILNGSMWFIYRYSYHTYRTLYDLGYKFITQIIWGEFYGGLGISYIFIKFSFFLQNYHLNTYIIFLLRMFIWIVFII